MDFLSFLGKLLPYKDKLDDLLEASDKILHGADSVAKWEGVKIAGDILVPAFHAVSGLSFSCEGDAIAHVSAKGFGDGTLIERLRKFYDSPVGKALIGLLLSQLTK